MFVFDCRRFRLFFRHLAQGDVKFAEVLEKMGATLTWEANAMTVSRDMETPLRGVDVDCGEIPDAAMTLAVSFIYFYRAVVVVLVVQEASPENS